jgi:hypothetical protein
VQVKIGDVVAWADAPSGALLQSSARGTIFVRIGDRGWVVGDANHVTCAFGRYCDGDEEAPWLWGIEENPLTILALGLTGSETKETLSMLVRHFEEAGATR